MTREFSPIDISTMPDLARLAEEVRATNRARALQRNHETVAVIVPVDRATARPRRAKQTTEADMQAFRAAAGSWKGLVDGEQLKKDIDDARGSDREFPAL